MEDGSLRGAALGALAEHFREAPEVRPLLLRRAVEDPDEDLRRAAVLGWAQAYRETLEQMLASRDLDGLYPGIDPRKPITPARLEKAAAELRKSTDQIKAAYEKLAEELPLKLEWRMPPHG